MKIISALIALAVLFSSCVFARLSQSVTLAAKPVRILHVAAGTDLKSLQWDHAFIFLPTAWQYAPNQGEGAVACDVDSGIDPSVTDTTAAVIDSINTTDQTSPDTWQDDVGHGTFTASQIAGNGSVLDAVAPKASLIIVKSLGPKGGDFLSISAGIIYCITHGADVVNMSFGGSDLSEHSAFQSLVDLGCQNGVDFTIAAGNSGGQNRNDPASVQSPCAITVNAISPDGFVAKFSDYGQTPNTVSAPGVGIVGHWGSQIGMGDGTSFGAPLVAGTIALLRAQGASATQAVAEILKTASPPLDKTIRGKAYAKLRRLLYGHGYLDAGAALRDWALQTKRHSNLEAL